MKRVISFILAAVVFVTLALCGTVSATEVDSRIPDENESVEVFIFLLQPDSQKIKESVIDLNGELLPGPFYEAFAKARAAEIDRIIDGFLKNYLPEDAIILYRSTQMALIGVRISKQTSEELSKCDGVNHIIPFYDDEKYPIAKKPKSMADSLFFELAMLQGDDVVGVPVTISLKDKENEELKNEIADAIPDDLTGEEYFYAFRDALHKIYRERIAEFTEKNLNGHGTIDSQCVASPRFVVSGLTKEDLYHIADLEDVLEIDICPPMTEGADEPLEYTDIPADSNWAYQGICFCIQNGYMQSTSTDKLRFEPYTKVSRAMVAVILYRIAGSPEVEYRSSFTDVAEKKWFTDAIEWCAQNGLASGKGNGIFDPNGDVTRQELAVFIYKLAEFQGKDMTELADLERFPDGKIVPDWAKTALAWCVNAGIISGKQIDGTAYLKPTDTAMRCELASILMRFVESNLNND